MRFCHFLLVCTLRNSYSLVILLVFTLIHLCPIRVHSYSSLTHIHSYTSLTRIHSSSLVLYSCSTCVHLFTRVLLIFTRVPSSSLVFCSCSTHALLVFYLYSLLFTLIHSYSTRVHPNSLVFIGVHWCSFVFPFVWCFRLDRFTVVVLVKELVWKQGFTI